MMHRDFFSWVTGSRRGGRGEQTEEQTTTTTTTKRTTECHMWATTGREGDAE